EDEDRPRRRGRSRDEEEEVEDRISSRRSPKDRDDDRPSRRSRDEDDEDEDDRPRRRRSRDDDEDEPLRKRLTRADAPRGRRRRRIREEGPWFTPQMKIGGGIAAGVLLLCLIAPLIFPPAVVLPVCLGLLLYVGGQIWFIIVAFKDDVMQGLLCWFIPLYAFYYLVVNWDEEKWPFFTTLAGFSLFLLSG